MFKKISLALVAAASITAAQAAEVTLYGDNYAFTFDDATLFGTANVVGDSLIFLPQAFNAESKGEVVITESVIAVTVESLSDSSAKISGLTVTEKGDYILSGADSKVRANARLDIFSLTQQGVSTGALVANTGILSTPTDLSNTEWSLYSDVDLNWGSDTAVKFTLENTLAALAGSEAGDLAFIAKKSGQVIINVQTEEVPVPAAAWLFGTALIGLGLRKAK